MVCMDSNMTRILQELTGAARDAADKAMAAASAAKDVVSEKYDAVRMALEHNRLAGEQEDVFSDIGRMMFLLHTGKVRDTVATEEGEKSPQQVIDALLLNAEQLGQQMDAIERRLAEVEASAPAPEEEEAGEPCPFCGHLCAGDDNFCCACGARLERPAPAGEAAPAEDAASAGDAPAEDAAPDGGEA